VSRSGRTFGSGPTHSLTKSFQWEGMSAVCKPQEMGPGVKSFPSPTKYTWLTCSKITHNVRPRLYTSAARSAAGHSIYHIGKMLHLGHFQWFSRGAPVYFRYINFGVSALSYKTPFPFGWSVSILISHDPSASGAIKKGEAPDYSQSIRTAFSSSSRSTLLGFKSI